MVLSLGLVIEHNAAQTTLLMLLVKEPRSGMAHTVSSNMLSIDSQVNQHKTILYRGVATETACNPRVITEEPNNLRQAFAIEAVS